MAATLAGVCQVPLTSVLLLFELTQDYRIVLPLLAAVGMSSWITSGQTERRDAGERQEMKEGNIHATQQPETSSSGPSRLFSDYVSNQEVSYTSNLCEVEDSLCLDDSDIQPEEFKDIFVSEAMRTRYVTVLNNTLLTEAVTLMLAEKQSCAMIVDIDNILIGVLTLEDIQEFSEFVKAGNRAPKEHLVSEMCLMNGKKCQVPWTATPCMDLLSAQIIMNKHGMNYIPVVSEHGDDCRQHPVGLLDRDCISLTVRALAARESLL